MLRGQPRRRFLKLGAAEISYLGNPAVTLTLSAYSYGRRALADVENKEGGETEIAAVGDDEACPAAG